MRFTNQIRRLLFGLPIAVTQSLVVVLPVAAWDWNPFQSADNSRPPAAKATVKSNRTSIAPTIPRWTDGGAQQALAKGTPQTGAVMQTAHTGPSRSGTLIGGEATTHASGNGAPTSHGQSLRMPTKLFTRGGNAPRPASMNPVNKKIPGAAVTPAATRQGSATPVASSRSST